MHAPDRPAIDVVDSTWLAASPSAVAAVLADAGNWRQWWPGLTMRMHQQRGDAGVRWHVDAVDLPVAAGVALAGSAEVWLESTCGGTVAHFFLRLDTAAADAPPRVAQRVSHWYRLRTKEALWALGDRLDPGRAARLTGVTAR